MTTRRTPIELSAAIIAMLFKKRRTVDELAELLGATRDSIRRHLDALDAEGVLHIEPECRASGRFARVYALEHTSCPTALSGGT